MSNAELLSPEFADDATMNGVRLGVFTLSQGAKGEGVVALQKVLTGLGVALVPDGSFGPRTQKALAEWQRSAGLNDSGELDSETLYALDHALDEKRRTNLHEAMARAAGVDPHQSAPAPRAPRQPAPRAEVPKDASFFEDTDALRPDGPGAAEDLDFPPPSVDKIKPLVAPGTPLPADRQEMLGRLKDVLGSDFSAHAALSRLVSSGRLHTGALLPNLLALATTKRHPELVLQGGIDSDLIVRQVVRHVDNPLRVQQGIGRGTCGAGVIEYLLLRHDASEFVRLVNGLTGFSGEATLRKGRTIKMPRTAIPRDETGRTDTDRLFQSTIMNHASAMSWIFDYDNPKDDESFWSSIKGNSQMPIWGFTSMYEDVLGESRTSVSLMLHSRDQLLDAAVADVSRGQRVPVILEFTSLHWLNVEWLERDSGGHLASVVLRNPWGWDDGSGSPPRRPVAEIGGRVRMKATDFRNALFAVVVKD
ncbi:MAG TPA: peptidoglycan-binding domain-containing protein [Polyangium sp.]|nr:peptidoglycan-binding domain-containing protein [Polyangium sp.]